MPEPHSYARDVRELTDLQAKLIAAIEDLLEAYEGFIAGAPEGGEVTMSAGPLTDMDRVRAFERQLAGLAGVRHVEVKGYEGEDRVILHVELSPPGETT